MHQLACQTSEPNAAGAAFHGRDLAAVSAPHPRNGSDDGGSQRGPYQRVLTGPYPTPTSPAGQIDPARLTLSPLAGVRSAGDFASLRRCCPHRVTECRDVLNQAPEFCPRDRYRIGGGRDRNTRAPAPRRAASPVGHHSNLPKEVSGSERRDSLARPPHLCGTSRDGVEVECKLAFVDDYVASCDVNEASNSGYPGDIPA